MLENALRYLSAGGTVVVALAEEGEDGIAWIDDRDPGMTEEELEHAFEPRYRGAVGQRLASQGQGPGLPIALRIVEASGGGMELRNRDGGGLRVSMALRVSMPEAAA